MSLTRKARAGFTLLEVLIAAMLLMIALLGSIALSVGLLRGNQFNRERDTAYFLAQQQIDLFSVQPITQILSNPGGFPNEDIASTSSPPTCYDVAQDAFVDSPISCLGNPPPAYYLRTWVCCVGPGGGGIPGGTCANPGGAPTVVSPNLGGVGGVCLINVEVTWPYEPVGVTWDTAPSSGWKDNNFLTVPPLGFTNHIFMSTVREQ
jgi:type II secretory pathway pseudopilin PulG